MRVRQHGELVAEIPNEALTDDAPLYKRPLERWEPPVLREMPSHIKLGRSGDLTENFKRLLASPNICGKRWVWQQYDHMVQTNTVEGPGAGDAGVIRIKGTQRGSRWRSTEMAAGVISIRGWARCMRSRKPAAMWRARVQLPLAQRIV